MRKESFSFEMEVYASIDRLPEKLGQLLLSAAEAIPKSYAPYSKFYVAAAALMQNGEIITGANFENAAYPMALCAERVVMAAAASRFPGMPIVSMAITAKYSEKALSKPIPPCGACRQVLAEMEYRDKAPVKIILGGEKGEIYVLESASLLLPFNFDGEFL